jgi:hypothetical protein
MSVVLRLLHRPNPFAPVTMAGAFLCRHKNILWGVQKANPT